MPTHLIIINGLLFLFGAILESALLLKMKIEKSTLYELLIVLGASSIVLVFFFVKGPTPLNLSFIHANQILILYFTIAYAIVFSTVFRKKILSPIDKQIFLIWTCIFLYDVIPRFGNGIYITEIISIIAVFMILNAFINLYIPPLIKVLFYGLYILYLVYFTLTQFILNYIPYISADLNLFEKMPIEISFFAGMTLVYLITHAYWLFRLMPPLLGHYYVEYDPQTYLRYRFIPATKDDKDIQQDMQEWAMDAAHILSQFSDKIPHPLLTSLIIILYTGLILANEWLHLMQTSTLTIFMLTSSFLFIQIQNGIILKNRNKRPHTP